MSYICIVKQSQQQKKQSTMETIKPMTDIELKSFIEGEIEAIRQFCPERKITFAAVKELISNATIYSFVAMREKEEIVSMIKQLA